MEYITISKNEIIRRKWHTRTAYIRGYKNNRLEFWTEEIYLLWNRGTKKLPYNDGWIYFSIGNKKYRTQLNG